MNKQLSVLALALLAAASVKAQSAGGGADLYGIVDVGAVWIDGAGDKTRRFVSSGQQSQQTPISGNALPDWVFAGVPLTIKAALAPTLGAQLNTSLENRFWHRQAWVGLVTPVGAVLLGRQYWARLQCAGGEPGAPLLTS